MFFYLYNGFDIYIKFETKRTSLVFLTGEGGGGGGGRERICQ